jgi:hypothetical protein
MLAAVLVLPACAGGGYTSAEFVYVEPAPYVYVVPVDRVVVVTREVLVTDGWTVFRVERSGPGRIVWARRGPNEVVRVFATPTGNRVAVRGVREIRVKDDRVRHKGWARRGGNDVVAKIDVRLRSRARR